MRDPAPLSLEGIVLIYKRALVMKFADDTLTGRRRERRHPTAVPPAERSPVPGQSAAIGRKR